MFSGNGEIDFEEFLEMMAGKMHAPTIDDEIQEAFKIFDRQSKGYITKNDSRSVHSWLWLCILRLPRIRTHYARGWGNITQPWEKKDLTHVGPFLVIVSSQLNI